VVKHYSQALHPDGKLWRVIYELRWLPRLALVCVLIWIGAMALDRAPPFKLLSYWTNQPKPGGTLVVRAKVHRDLDRECSVAFSRYLFDRFGARHERAVDPDADRRVARVVVEVVDALRHVALRCGRLPVQLASCRTT